MGVVVMELVGYAKRHGFRPLAFAMGVVDYGFWGDGKQNQFQTLGICHGCS